MSRINVMQPWLGAEEIAAVTEVISSGWVAQGPRVAAFEAEFARVQQAAFAVATSSCTTALHLALVVAGVGAGDEVVVPSFSFIATANAAVYVGARPVFADVDPVTGNLTAETVAAAILDYIDLGADLISIRGYDTLADAVDYGRYVLPLVRQELAHRAATGRRGDLQATHLGALAATPGETRP